jgi:hypothetical protein
VLSAHCPDLSGRSEWGDPWGMGWCVRDCVCKGFGGGGAKVYFEIREVVGHGPSGVVRLSFRSWIVQAMLLSV